MTVRLAFRSGTLGHHRQESSMLSKKAKYAVKALLALAEQGTGESMRIADLERQERIPKKFLEAILLSLKNHGLLQSRKGQGDDYLLARDPRQNYLGQIVRMFDGPLAPVPCASQTAYVRWEAVIRHLRFHGSSLLLELDRLADGQVMEAEIPRARFEELGLTKGQHVFPSPRSVRVFPEREPPRPPE